MQTILRWLVSCRLQCDDVTGSSGSPLNVKLTAASAALIESRRSSAADRKSFPPVCQLEAPRCRRISSPGRSRRSPAQKNQTKNVCSAVEVSCRSDALFLFVCCCCCVYNEVTAWCILHSSRWTCACAAHRLREFSRVGISLIALRSWM